MSVPGTRNKAYTVVVNDLPTTTPGLGTFQNIPDIIHLPRFHQRGYKTCFRHVFSSLNKLYHIQSISHETPLQKEERFQSTDLSALLSGGSYASQAAAASCSCDLVGHFFDLIQRFDAVRPKSITLSCITFRSDTKPTATEKSVRDREPVWEYPWVLP